MNTKAISSLSKAESLITELSIEELEQRLEMQLFLGLHELCVGDCGQACAQKCGSNSRPTEQ